MIIPAEPRAIPTITDGVMQVLRTRSGPRSASCRSSWRCRRRSPTLSGTAAKATPHEKSSASSTATSPARSSIVVRDPGAGFDATTVPNPLAGENLLKSSGRGIFLINQLMDEVAFKDGGRELRMRKRNG